MALDPLQREFVRKCISPDQSSLTWGLQRLKVYLRELKARSRAEEIQITLTKVELCPLALEWIQDYDPDLELFQRHHRDFELSRAKASGIFRMPGAIAEFEGELRGRLPHKDYQVLEAIDPGDEEISTRILEVSHSDARLSATIGEIVRSSLTLPFEQDDLPGVWDSLQQAGSRQMPDASRLKRCSLTFEVEARAITTVTLDFRARVIEISTDTFRFRDDQETALSNYSQRFHQALEVVLPGLTNSEIVIENALMQPGITPATARLFRMLRTDDRLAVSYAITQEFGDPDEAEEQITNRFRGQKREIILQKVSRFYQERGTFLNFLEEHVEHDPDRTARAHRHLQELTTLGESGCTCLVFFPRERRGGDPRHRDNGGPATVVECVKITLDPESGIVRGDSKDDTAEQLDVILAEIRKLLQTHPGFV